MASFPAPRRGLQKIGKLQGEDKGEREWRKGLQRRSKTLSNSSLYKIWKMYLNLKAVPPLKDFTQGGRGSSEAPQIREQRRFKRRCLSLLTQLVLLPDTGSTCRKRNERNMLLWQRRRRRRTVNQPSLQSKVRKGRPSRVGAQKRPKGSSLLLGVIIASPWGVLYVCKLNLCR